MTEAWLYRAQDGEVVPGREDALPRLVREGRIGAATPLWRSGEPEAGTAGAALPRLFAEPPPYTGPPVGWTEATPRPWRRFFARAVDVAVVGGSLLAILTASLPGLLSVDEAESARFLKTWAGTVTEGVAGTFLTLPVNAASMATFGTTLGKSLFGLRVTRDGGRLPLRTALRREGRVWLQGQALGLLLIEFVGGAAAYRRLTRTGTTAWDEALGLRVASRPLSRTRVAGLAGLGLVIAALAALGYMI